MSNLNSDLIEKIGSFLKDDPQSLRNCFAASKIFSSIANCADHHTLYCDQENQVYKFSNLGAHVDYMRSRLKPRLRSLSIHISNVSSLHRENGRMTCFLELTPRQLSEIDVKVYVMECTDMVAILRSLPQFGLRELEVMFPPDDPVSIHQEDVASFPQCPLFVTMTDIHFEYLQDESLMSRISQLDLHPLYREEGGDDVLRIDLSHVKSGTYTDVVRLQLMDPRLRTVGIECVEKVTDITLGNVHRHVYDSLNNCYFVASSDGKKKDGLLLKNVIFFEPDTRDKYSALHGMIGHFPQGVHYIIIPRSSKTLFFLNEFNIPNECISLGRYDELSYIVCSLVNRLEPRIYVTDVVEGNNVDSVACNSVNLTNVSVDNGVSVFSDFSKLDVLQLYEFLPAAFKADWYWVIKYRDELKLV